MENYRQKYEQALERAKGMYEQGMMPERIEYIFPELKESEDERIRKELIMFLECCQDTRLIGNNKRDKWILWLEDKVEPKFKVGDTIINTYFRWDGNRRIREITDGKYIFDDGSYINIKEQDEWELDEWILCLENKPKFKVGDWVVRNYTNHDKIVNKVINVNQFDAETYGYKLDDGSYFSGSFEKEYRLWSIEDAENGDVLCYKDDILLLDYYFLFNKVGCHCCYTNKGFIPHNIYSFTKADFDKIHPATKEQCYFLFSKMKEAGYKWDSKNKELII